MREELREFVDSALFRNTIMVVILINAVVIGIETFDIDEGLRVAFERFDAICLAIYICELVIKLYARGKSFFNSKWNIFDFAIVVLSLVPTSLIPVPVQAARVLRMFRVLRTFRLISAFVQLRVIIESLVKSLPGIFWATIMLVVLSYIYGIAGVSMFGIDFPRYFGDLFKALFTLFQFATIEGWPDISRDICEAHPWAWLYFVSFVFIAGFVIMNVVVGVIVNAVEESQIKTRTESAVEANSDTLANLSIQLGELHKQLEVVEHLAEKAINEEREEERQTLLDTAKSAITPNQNNESR